MSDRITAGAAGAVRRWVRIYTVGLPPQVRRDRQAEIDSDLWEQQRDAEAAGQRSHQAAFQILGRVLTGVPADITWRAEQTGAGREAAVARRGRAVHGTLGWTALAVAGVLAATWSLYALVPPTRILLVVFGPLLPALAAAGLLPFRALRPAVRWLGLLTVASGTSLAFSSSAVLTERGSIGFGGGFLVAFVYGLMGLTVVLGGLRIGQARFLFPPSAVATGLLYVASFYAYLPPRELEPWAVVWMVPGLALAALGVVQWRRYRPASTGRMRHGNTD